MYNITIKFLEDNDIKYFPDISYDNYVYQTMPFEEQEKHFFNGTKNVAYDIAYYQYLRRNNMMELTDLNSETTSEITLIIEDDFSGRVLKFKCVYDSDNDEMFDSEEYFKK